MSASRPIHSANISTFSSELSESSDSDLDAVESTDPGRVATDFDAVLSPTSLAHQTIGLPHFPPHFVAQPPWGTSPPIAVPSDQPLRLGTSPLREAYRPDSEAEDNMRSPHGSQLEFSQQHPHPQAIYTGDPRFNAVYYIVSQAPPPVPSSHIPSPARIPIPQSYVTRSPTIAHYSPRAFSEGGQSSVDALGFAPGGHEDAQLELEQMRREQEEEELPPIDPVRIQKIMQALEMALTWTRALGQTESSGDTHAEVQDAALAILYMLMSRLNAGCSSRYVPTYRSLQKTIRSLTSWCQEVIAHRLEYDWSRVRPTLQAYTAKLKDIYEALEVSVEPSLLAQRMNARIEEHNLHREQAEAERREAKQRALEEKEARRAARAEIRLMHKQFSALRRAQKEGIEVKALDDGGVSSRGSLSIQNREIGSIHGGGSVSASSNPSPVRQVRATPTDVPSMSSLGSIVHHERTDLHPDLESLVHHTPKPQTETDPDLESLGHRSHTSPPLQYPAPRSRYTGTQRGDEDQPASRIGTIPNSFKSISRSESPGTIPTPKSPQSPKPTSPPQSPHPTPSESKSRHIKSPGQDSAAHSRYSKPLPHRPFSADASDVHRTAPSGHDAPRSPLNPRSSPSSHSSKSEELIVVDLESSHPPAIRPSSPSHSTALSHSQESGPVEARSHRSVRSIIPPISVTKTSTVGSRSRQTSGPSRPPGSSRGVEQETMIVNVDILPDYLGSVGLYPASPERKKERSERSARTGGDGGRSAHSGQIKAPSIVSGSTGLDALANVGNGGVRTPSHARARTPASKTHTRASRSRPTESEKAYEHIQIGMGEPERDSGEWVDEEEDDIQQHEQQAFSPKSARTGNASHALGLTRSASPPKSLPLPVQGDGNEVDNDDLMQRFLRLNTRPDGDGGQSRTGGTDIGGKHIHSASSPSSRSAPSDNFPITEKDDPPAPIYPGINEHGWMKSSAHPHTMRVASPPYVQVARNSPQPGISEVLEPIITADMPIRSPVTRPRYDFMTLGRRAIERAAEEAMSAPGSTRRKPRGLSVGTKSDASHRHAPTVT